jgi:hypothetical protein
MNKTLKTLAEIKAALSQPGAQLVFDERCMVQSYFVEVAGCRTRCSQTADRLTWSKNAFVRFSHRTNLERFYVVASDRKAK